MTVTTDRYFMLSDWNVIRTNTDASFNTGYIILFDVTRATIQALWRSG